jgi:hypothetical protein
MDPTVTVYEYELYEPERRRWRKAEGRATAAAIERAGGVALRLTALVVDARLVDERGHLAARRTSDRSHGETEKDPG